MCAMWFVHLLIVPGALNDVMLVCPFVKKHLDLLWAKSPIALGAKLVMSLLVEVCCRRGCMVSVLLIVWWQQVIAPWTQPTLPRWFLTPSDSMLVLSSLLMRVERPRLWIESRRPLVRQACLSLLARLQARWYGRSYVLWPLSCLDTDCDRK